MSSVETREEGSNYRPYYGTPLPVGGRLFVPCRDGAVYVFDIARLTGR